ncbi:MAG: flavodoxin domain-containing protein, partial [Deltaproteobacteria bacterium]|nr:flavodoxin domain-containing protein [Deltaproteobacteria bacterium]
MKVLVTYYSETGNTEKVARAIYEGVDETLAEKKIAPVDEVQDPAGYDLYFVGFPVISHSVPKKAAQLLKSLPE